MHTITLILFTVNATVAFALNRLHVHKSTRKPFPSLKALHNYGTIVQGAKKIIFTACHSGKLKLTFF